MKTAVDEVGVSAPAPPGSSGGSAVGASVKDLIETVYPELRRAARAVMLGERSEHTLQPTAVVHEAILNVLGLHSVRIESAEHLFSLAVRQMRRVLTSYARRKLAQKRVGAVSCVTEQLPDLAGIDVDQVVIVDQVLDRLAMIDPSAHKVVTLRFFGSLSVQETAAVLGVSTATVERDWRFARCWLFGELR